MSKRQKELAAIQNLSELSLNSTAVTTAGLKELAAIKNLSSLDLGLNTVTDSATVRVHESE